MEETLGDQLDQFMDSCLQYFIDSNVFLRCVILSVYHWTQTSDEVEMLDFVNVPKMKSKIANKVMLNLKLIVNGMLKSVSRENISTTSKLV